MFKDLQGLFVLFSANFYFQRFPLPRESFFLLLNPFIGDFQSAETCQHDLQHTTGNGGKLKITASRRSRNQQQDVREDFRRFCACTRLLTNKSKTKNSLIVKSAFYDLIE